MFKVDVIADSYSPWSEKRLTTLALVYPRFIHSEFMTHRVFSRNATSSRAIPVKTMVASTLGEPAMFVHVGSNRPGMQAHEEVPPDVKEKFEREWVDLCLYVSAQVLRWSEDGIHKQVANRALEPWTHMTTLVSATEWENFFELRCHPDAQPEFQHLANMVSSAMNESSPRELDLGDWHMPFIKDEEVERYEIADLIKASAARCARVSYLNHDKTEPTVQKDLDLWEKLVGSRPRHSSPTEHQATPSTHGSSWANFRGWTQQRWYIDNGLTMPYGVMQI